MFIFDLFLEFSKQNFWNFNCSAITINYKMVDEDIKPVVSLLCGCCQNEIQPNKYVDHFKFMAQHRWNGKSNLTWDGWYRQIEMEFMRTKIVFKNGLVVDKRSAVRTNIANFDGFKEMAKNTYDSLKNNHSKK